MPSYKLVCALVAFMVKTASSADSSGISGSITALAATTTSAPFISTTSTSSLLHPIGNTTKCLDVRGGIFQNGTPVQSFDCNGTPSQNWDINPGQGPVILSGTKFCLDAGSDPANGVGMKIWQCFDNLPAQDWFYTDDDRIALTNQGFCLDLTDGNLANANQVQIWKCTSNDINQIWTTSPGGSINTTSTALPTSTAASATTAASPSSVLSMSAFLG